MTLPIGRELPARRVASLVALGAGLGAGLAALALLLVLFAQPVRAASPNPDGCPDGFHWERMSGVGCVQDSLPPNARYGYTSAAICNDPYLAVHAPGPNAFGADPSVNYLVECITAEEAQRRAEGDVPVSLGSGPLDEVAGFLAEGDPVLPDPKDSDTGGLAATAALMVSAIAAAMVTGTALGTVAKGAAAGAAGGGGGAGPTGAGTGGEFATGAAAAPPGPAGGDAASAAAVARQPIAAALDVPLQVVGGLTTAAGSGLPLPRAELVSAGLSIARSVKRLTDNPDASGYSPGDVVQLLGDAASIGALATILAPATGLVSLAGAGAATVAEAASPGEVLERLRRSFGQLGYMQGVLDENVSGIDGQLTGLDGALRGVVAVPRDPGDPTILSAKELRDLRSAWAAHTDVLFDALIDAEAEMGDLDNRRRNLAHQIDAVNDLLARLDDSGKTPVPPHLGDTLCYGLGWFQAGDPARMAAALRESRAQTLATGMAAVLRESPAMARASAMVAATAAQAPNGPVEPAPTVQPAPAGKKGKTAGPGKGAPSMAEAVVAPVAAATPRSLPFGEWAAANGFEGGRMGVLQALAGLERWSGFYDALTGTLQRQITTLRSQADAAGATRRVLSSETQHRTLEAGR